MTSDMTICVVGGGIGGLAVAAAFARRGAQVCVLEQAEAIREVGAGLQISPNGHCVLDALGVSEALQKTSVRGLAVSLRRAESDREVARLDIANLKHGRSYQFVHRADLLAVLLDAAVAAGVEIRLDHKVRGITPADRPSVQLASGADVHADLVIDAGGLHSTLRPVLNGASEPFFTGQVAWRAIVPNIPARGAQVHVHMAPRSHVVSYPLRSGTHLNIVAVQERDAWADEGWAHSDDPANLQRAFKTAAPPVRDMLARAGEVNLWGLFRHPVAEVWHGGNTALVGDAAHPTLPFLAQGANMALEDAWALAGCVDAFGAQDGLPAYQTLRRARALRAINTANGNAWRYHLPHGPVRFAAHSALKIASTVAPSLMTKPFDWLYNYDVVQEVAAATS